MLKIKKCPYTHARVLGQKGQFPYRNIIYALRKHGFKNVYAEFTEYVHLYYVGRHAADGKS